VLKHTLREAENGIFPPIKVSSAHLPDAMNDSSRRAPANGIIPYVVVRAIHCFIQTKLAALDVRRSSPGPCFSLPPVRFGSGRSALFPRANCRGSVVRTRRPRGTSHRTVRMRFANPAQAAGVEPLRYPLAWNANRPTHWSCTFDADSLAARCKECIRCRRSRSGR